MANFLEDGHVNPKQDGHEDRKRDGHGNRKRNRAWLNRLSEFITKVRKENANY